MHYLKKLIYKCLVVSIKRYRLASNTMLFFIFFVLAQAGPDSKSETEWQLICEFVNDVRHKDSIALTDDIWFVYGVRDVYESFYYDAKKKVGRDSLKSYPNYKKLVVDIQAMVQSKELDPQIKRIKIMDELLYFAKSYFCEDE